MYFKEMNGEYMTEKAIDNQIENAQHEGLTELKLYVNNKKDAIQTFSYLSKKGYSPELNEDNEGKAFIQIELKRTAQYYSKNVIQLKTRAESRVLSRQDNVINVQFGMKNTLINHNNENNVVVLKKNK